MLKVSHYEEIPRKGINCKIGNNNILVGNETLLKENNILFQPSKDIGTIIYASKNDEFIGYIVISDKIKDNNFSELKKHVNKEIIILSGDNKKQVEEIAKELGVNTFYNNLLPVDKAKKVESYKKNGTTIFVGDGINDAPVLKIADVGISMGNLGSEAAIEASDVVLMNDNLNSINKVIDIAKTTKRKVKYSIIFSLLVKFIVLFLGLLGKSTMLLAVFADVGVALYKSIDIAPERIDHLRIFADDMIARRIEMFKIQSNKKKVYPNDPCPCGSGKKYKKCCGRR